MAENYTPPKTKTPLFDRIFKPQTITLANGNTVERPRSRLPLIALCVVLAVIWSLRMTGFDITVIIRKGGNIVAILEKLFRGIDVPGYATQTVLILFFGSAQLLCLGIIGEYVGKIFEQSKHRPIYIAKEILDYEQETKEEKRG